MASWLCVAAMAVAVMGTDSEFDASNDILTLPKTGLGEGVRAQAKAGMPGPFSAVPASSIGTAGYTVHMNKYEDVDTTVGLNCNGDLNGGKVQSYDKDAKPPDLTKCNKKCNDCTGCGGFVDMINEKRCYFYAAVSLKQVSVSAGINVYKKYWNKVKTYKGCIAGTWSAIEGTECKKCSPGHYANKDNRGAKCFPCRSGMYVVAAGKDSCDLCPRGKYSEKQKGSTACKDCPIAFWAHTGAGNCKRCTPGHYGTTKGLTGSKGATGECKKCAAGQYTKLPGFGQTSCAKCPAGRFGEAGARRCSLCHLGTFSLEGASVCTDCAVGKHMSYRGGQQCTACRSGRYAVSRTPRSCFCCANPR